MSKCHIVGNHMSRLIHDGLLHFHVIFERNKTIDYLNKSLIALRETILARVLKPIQRQYDIESSYHYHVITFSLHPGITFSVLSYLLVFYTQKTGVLEKAANVA